MIDFRTQYSGAEPSTTGSKIPASKYVHDVYSDALSLYQSAAAKWQIPALDVYGFIDKVSPVTTQRLIDLGAHQASSRLAKTEYLIDFQLSYSEVESSWLKEWQDSLSKVSYGLGSYSPIDQVADKAGHAVKKSADWLFWAGLIAYFMNDAYTETKRSVSNSINSSASVGTELVRKF